MKQLVKMEQKGVTLYKQLASLLRGRILSGDWKCGDRLPSIPEMCDFYGVGTITVRQALAELGTEGLINSERGRGTFVTADIVSPANNKDLRKAINDPLSLAPGQTIEQLLREPVSELPATMKSGQHECATYMRIRTIHHHRGIPFGVMDSYVASETYDLFPKGDDERHKIGYLVRRYGHLQLATVRQEMTVAYADQETANLLTAETSSYSWLAYWCGPADGGSMITNA